MRRGFFGGKKSTKSASPPPNPVPRAHRDPHWGAGTMGSEGTCSNRGGRTAPSSALLAAGCSPRPQSQPTGGLSPPRACSRLSPCPIPCTRSERGALTPLLLPQGPEAPRVPALPRPRAGPAAGAHAALQVQGAGRDVPQRGHHRRDALQPRRDHHLRQGQAGGAGHDAQVSRRASRWVFRGSQL